MQKQNGKEKKYFYVKQVKNSRANIVAECHDRFVKKQDKTWNLEKDQLFM